MENASKALIIAGAILLSIVIISLGLVVVNRTRNSISNANVDQQEIASFNNQFESYVGNNKTSSQVKSLAQSIQSSNVTENNNGTKRFITFTEGTIDSKETTNGRTVDTLAGAPIDLSTINGLASSRRFTITIQYAASTGYVCSMMYKQQGD